MVLRTIPGWVRRQALSRWASRRTFLWILMCLLVGNAGPLVASTPSAAGFAGTDYAGTGYAGTIPGAFAVGSSGGALYHVRLKLPPGTAGMQPKLALAYSSHAGDGLLGMGWRLTGLSKIERCAPMVAQDGFAAPITYGASDRFCLDGQRLIAVENARGEKLNSQAQRAAAYGQDGTVYHTEIESWRKVISKTTSGVDGPSSFQVWNKRGHVLEYGAAGPSGGLSSRVLALGKKSVRVWALSRVTDLNGNSMTFTYGSDAGAGNYFPLQIDYTSHAAQGLKPQRQVSFAYDHQRSDPVPTYSGGSRVEQKSLLTSITTSVDGKTVRTYSLSYDRGAATGRYRLTQLTEADAEGKILPPTTFQWQDNNPQDRIGQGTTLSPFGGVGGDSVLSMDANGDGLIDLVAVAADAGNPVVLTPLLSTSDGFQPAEVLRSAGVVGKFSARGMDVNGDGLVDVVCLAQPSQGTLQTAVFLARIQGGKFGFEDGTLQNHGEVAGGEQILSADVDSDGRSDLVAVSNVAGAEIAVRVLLSNGDGFGAASVQSPENLQGGAGLQVLAADVNGDRMADLIYAVDQQQAGLKVQVQLATPKGYSATVHTSQLEIQGGGPLMPMDVNGDGMGDLVFLASNPGAPVEVWPMLSNGAGGFVSPSAPFRSSVTGGGDALPLDINGDGLTDLAYVANATGAAIQVRFFVSNGTSFDESAAPIRGPNGGVPLYPIDVNGDRKTDIVQAQLVSDSDSLAATLMIATEPRIAPDLLSKITNGLGGQDQISYLPLTDSEVYSRGASDKTSFEVAGLVNPIDGARYTVSAGASGLTPGLAGAVFPTVTVDLPTYVVRNHHRLDGRGADYGYTYNYADGKVDRDGRGWLGFASQTLLDPNLGNTTITRYLQDFPFTGTVDGEQVQVTSSSEILRTKKVTYAPSSSPHYAAVYRVLEAKSQHSRYAEGQLDYTLERQLEHDDYGNVTLLADLGVVAGNVPSKPLYTHNTYSNDPKTWRLGYATGKKVTADSAGQQRLQGTEKTYDGAMNLATHGVWQGASVAKPWLVTSYGYDAFGNRTSVTDPAGGTTTTRYDSTYHSFPASVTRPANAEGQVLPSVTYLYDARFGERISTTGENGHTLTQTLDGLGRRLEKLGPPADSPKSAPVVLEKTGWVAASGETYLQKLEALDWTGQSFRSVRKYKDGLGRTYREEMTGPAGKVKVIDRLYDSANRITQRTFPYYQGESSLDLSKSFDAQGRIVKTQEEISSDQILTTTYRYPGGGQTIKTRASGTPAAATLKTTVGFFASSPHPITQVDAGGTTTNFTRDPLGRVTEVATSADSVVTRTRYDGKSRQVFVEVAEASGSATYMSYAYDYDEHGRRMTQTDSANNVLTFTYDARQRLIERQAVDAKTKGSSVTTLTYDNPQGQNTLGRLSGVSVKGLESYAFDYDLYGHQSTIRLTLEGETYTTERAFLPSGKVAQETFPDGAKRINTYFEDSRLKSVQLAGEQVIAYDDYAAMGKPGTLRFGAADSPVATTTFQYDQLGRIVNHQVESAGDTILDRQLQWLPTPPLQSLTDLKAPADDRQYGYDGAGRLTSVRSKAGGADLAKFAYDGVGNLTGQESTTYSYSGFQLTGSSGGGKAEYDGVGNLTQSSFASAAATYTYDAQNRLIRAAQADKVTSMVYDYTGRRIRKTSADGTQTTYVSPSFVVTELPGGATLKTKTIQGLGATLAAITSGPAGAGGSAGVPSPGTAYFHLDHLGSVRFATDAQGQVRTTVDYSPYGQPTLKGPDDFRQKFTGMELDDTGLYYFQARYFDPKLGRFLTADSEIGGHTERPDRFNRYAYALNNPVLYVDPTGHMATWLEDTLQISLDVAEVAAGVTLTVVTDGALGSTIGGSLIGAGLSGGIYNFTHLSHPSWKDWGIQQAIGAVGGLITGGIGSAGGALVDSAFFDSLTAVSDSGFEEGTMEWLGESITNLGKQTLKYGTPLAIGALAGAASSVSGQLIKNWADGEGFVSGFKHLKAGPILIGAVAGGVGAGASEVTGGGLGLEKPDLENVGHPLLPDWANFTIERAVLVSSGFQWAKLIKPLTFNANKLLTHYEPNW